MNKKSKSKVADMLSALVSTSDTPFKEVLKTSPAIFTKTSDGLGEDNSGAKWTQLELIHELLSATYLEDQLYEECLIINVSEKAHGLKVPIVNERSRTVQGGIKGGFLAYEVTEGTDITLSNGKWKEATDLALNQVGIVVPVTNALLQDSTALTSYVGLAMTEELRYLTGRYIIYGNGATQMYGIGGTTSIGIRATKFVTGMSAPYTAQNIRDIYKCYYGGTNGVWVMGHQAWREVMDVYSSSTYPTFPMEFEEGGEAWMFGHRVIRADYMNDRDIVLGDFSTYIIAQKPLREDVSEQLYFSSNQSAFRTIARLNGCPIWGSGIREQDGGKVYPFVMSKVEAPSGNSSSSSETETSVSEVSTNSSSSSSHSPSSKTSFSHSYSSLSSASSPSSSHSKSSNSKSSKSNSSASTQSNSSKSSASQSSHSESSHSESSHSDSSKSTVSGSSLSSRTPSSLSTVSPSSASSASVSSASLSSASLSSRSWTSQSESSPSLSSPSSSIGLSSSSTPEGCNKNYCASTFSTGAYNGTYARTGTKYDTMETYFNGNWYIWYEAATNRWWLSATVGATMINRKSSKSVQGGCPDGAWSSEDGLLVAGSC